MKAAPGQQARTQQSTSQPQQQRPATSAGAPVVIITSSNPPSMGLKPPAPFDMVTASPPHQHGGGNGAAAQPDPSLDVDRCPSPIPVTLDDFRSSRAEEGGADDLQGLELPWASQKSASPTGSPRKQG